MSTNYHEDVKVKNTILLRELLKKLPDFTDEFFRGISDRTSSRTRIGYGYDLRLFFEFLTTQIPKFNGIETKDFTIDNLQQVEIEDIEKYMEYISYYTKIVDGQKLGYKNDVRGKSRKLASVRTLFSYFYKKRKIKADTAALMEFPKVHDKVIVKLDVNEVAKLLDEVESGEKLTDRQKKYHEHTQLRDMAIITLMLGTGMRVSECVGINIEHIDFDQNAVKITRKGGDEAVLYFNSEVRGALLDYLNQRKNINALAGHEHALFLSLQNRRITDRAIQNLVRKYTKNVTKVKKITPHKLRSTFGTNMYKETGDIYLVAEILGHEDVNTTKKHYAKMEDERLRMAARMVKLRES